MSAEHRFRENALSYYSVEHLHPFKRLRLNGFFSSRGDIGMKTRFFHVTLPLKRPFAHMAHKRTTSDSVVLMVEHQSVIGIGECAPRKYVTGETPEQVIWSVKSALKSRGVAEALEASPTEFLSGMLNGDKRFSDIASLPNNARCLLEMALLDWLCHARSIALCDVIAASFESSLMPSKEITRVLDGHRNLDDFLSSDGPFHCIKVKATINSQSDIEAVEKLRESIGPNRDIIVDANMGWTDENARSSMAKLGRAGATLFEEPLPARRYLDLADLRATTNQPIMLDESLCTLQDGEEAIARSSVDAFNIRISKNGGISGALGLIRLAQSSGIRWQLGVQVAEVGPLVAAERHLACTVGGYLTVEAGIGDEIFDEFVVDPYPTPDRKNNTIILPPGNGLGVQLSSNINKYKTALT